MNSILYMLYINIHVLLLCFLDQKRRFSTMILRVLILFSWKSSNSFSKSLDGWWHCQPCSWASHRVGSPHHLRRLHEAKEILSAETEHPNLSGKHRKLPSLKRSQQANAPENRQNPIPKGNESSEPTIDFQVLLLLVSGRVPTTIFMGHSFVFVG